MAEVIEVHVRSAERGPAVAELGGALHAALTAPLGQLAAALRDALFKAAAL